MTPGGEPSVPRSGRARPAPTWQVPRALLEGLAHAWVALAGGRVEVRQGAAGTFVGWSPEGPAAPMALPNRLYGLADAQVDVLCRADVPSGWTVHLPPGVLLEGDQTPHAVSHLMTLTEHADADVLASRVRRVGRQGVRKAARHGVLVRPGRDEEWHGLASAKCRAKGAPPPPPSLPAALRHGLGDEAVRILVAEWGGRACAAVLLAEAAGYGMFVDGASDPTTWGVCPNNAVVWEALVGFARRGARRIDFGFSEPGSGDGRFKAHMGGEPVPLQRVTGA